jgi:membrane-associated phospholipid phosphatase
MPLCRKSWMALCLVFSLAVAPLAAHAEAPTSQPATLAPDSFDLETLLGNPPPDDSVEHRVEIDELLMLQNDRTPTDIARCVAEDDATVFSFADVLGPTFDEKNLPITTQLIGHANKVTKAILSAAKNKYHRPRPPVDNPQINPCLKLDNTFSYPSGHAVRGIVWATLLSEIFPSKKDALMARGRQIGEDRLLAGMHYPSDIVAGQKLGAEIARRLLADPTFADRLAAARQECQSIIKP